MGAIAFISLFLAACSAPAEQQEGNMYRNPVCESPRLPDPSLIRADGAFYLYATESSGRVPVMRSEDLVHWNYHASAFPEGGKPNLSRTGVSKEIIETGYPYLVDIGCITEMKDGKTLQDRLKYVTIT